MIILIVLTALVILVVVGAVIYSYKRTLLVGEDKIAISVNRDGFINRMLPAGRHMLYPFERVEFVLETKNKVISNQVNAVATSDAILININWSASFSLKPDLITERISQRLRSLPNAEKSVARQTDVCLRKLVGDYTMHDLFKPATRDRIERQLAELMTDRLKSFGVVFNFINLQAIDLPREVAEALNKAKAIETLDRAIRQVDPATREVVRSACQLDEILRWEAHLPTPSRPVIKRNETVAH